MVLVGCVGTLGSVAQHAKLGGVRLQHVQLPDRAVRVPGREPGRESARELISWEAMTRVGAVREKVGRGQSGLRYVLRRSGDWRVLARGGSSEVQVGSARLQDHALALAQMWEQAVLSGRIDMG